MTDRPNFLIFMTDQQRGDTVLIDSIYKAKTPHLDAFRENGLQFSRAYCPSPHCCPSRATFMSGLYPSEHNVWHNVDVANAISRDLRPGARLWSEDLADAGYAMHYSGKWHVSAYDSPKERGWSTNYIGHPRAHDRATDYWSKGMEKDWSGYEYSGDEADTRGWGQILRPGYPTYTHYGEGAKTTDEAAVADGIQEMERNAKSGSPWCSMISVNGPHDPYFVPKKYLDRYDLDEIELPPNFDDDLVMCPGLYRRVRDRFAQLSREEHREAILHYLAYCSYMDDLFGQVLRALDGSGQRENTVVIYLSDHGDYAGEHGLWTKGLPCFRSAYHVPAVVQWNRGLARKGEVESAFVSLSDFAPTILELSGIHADREFSGLSLAPFLRGATKPEDWRDALFTQSNGNELYGIQRSVMTDKWKFVYNGFDYDELYDLENDPWEVENVAAFEEHREIRKELSRSLWEFARDRKDACVNKYIMVALAEYGPGVAVKQKREPKLIG